ncbi:MAG: hypothetical protein AB1758_38150 [Candidatus Eremiobacterota bacterium]
MTDDDFIPAHPGLALRVHDRTYLQERARKASWELQGWTAAERRLTRIRRGLRWLDLAGWWVFLGPLAVGCYSLASVALVVWSGVRLLSLRLDRARAQARRSREILLRELVHLARGELFASLPVG